MLKEIENVSQSQNEPGRRWFSDAEIDLYLWYDKDNNITQFQICYNKGPGEQALTWNNEDGFSQHDVDDGEGGIYRMKSSPILLNNAELDLKTVNELFLRHAQKIDHDIYMFIASHLENS